MTACLVFFIGELHVPNSFKDGFWPKILAIATRLNAKDKFTQGEI